MIEYRRDRNGELFKLENEDLMEATASVLRPVQILHSRILRQNKDAARAVRTMVKLAVDDADSPLFRPDASRADAETIIMGVDFTRGVTPHAESRFRHQKDSVWRSDILGVEQGPVHRSDRADSKSLPANWALRPDGGGLAQACA